MSSPAGSTRSSEFGNDGYKYKCTICGIGFQYKKGFNHHMNIHAEKHPCQECKKYFGNKEELRIHKRSHPVKKRVPCPTCHRSFVCLHTHVKSCSKKVCCLSFSPWSSRIRSRRMFNETGHKQYEIPNFRSYQKIHTDKLKCDICDKRWPSSSELFRHKRTHIDRMVNHVPITPDIDNHVPLFELSDSSFEEPPAEAVDPWRDYFCLHATEPSVEKFDGGEVNTAPVVIRADPSVEPRHNVIDNVEFNHVPEGDRHGPVIDLWHSSFEELLSEAVDQPSTSTELYQRFWIEEGGMDYHAPDDHNEPQEAKVAETKSTRIAQNGSGKKDEISAAKQKRGASLRESSKLIVEDPLAKKPSTEEDLKTILKQMNGDFAKKMEQQKRDFEKQIEQQKNEKNQLKENYEERIVQQKKDFEAKMKQSEHFILEEPSTIAGRPPSTIENSFGKKIGNLARESVPLAGSFNFEELNVKKARTGVDFDEIVSQLKNDFVQKMEQQSKDFDEKIVLQMRGYQRRDESQRGAVDSERDQKQAPNLQSRKRKKFRRHDYHSRNWKISSSEDESDESPAEGSVSGVPIGRSNDRNTKKTTGSHQETGTADVFITYADFNLPNRCVFCWKQDHPSGECRHFDTVEYRLYMKERSNLCPKCLLFHPGKLCFKTVKCDHCQAEDHHSYLCPSDTHRQYLGQFCK